MLGLPERRVRELARDALVDLAPLSARGVEEDWRGQLADYVLGQQAGPEVTATRGHLRRSENARIWTRSLLDSLEQLYQNGDLPAIPEGERGAGRRSAARATGEATASEAVTRRRILAAAGVVALLLVGVLVWPGGVLTGGDDGERQAGGSGNASGDQQAAAGEGGAVPVDTQGQAIVARAGGQDPARGHRHRPRAEHPAERIPGVALQLRRGSQVAGSDGDRPAGKPAVGRRAARGLPQVPLHRRDLGRGRAGANEQRLPERAPR